MEFNPIAYRIEINLQQVCCKLIYKLYEKGLNSIYNTRVVN